MVVAMDTGTTSWVNVIPSKESVLKDHWGVIAEVETMTMGSTRDAATSPTPKYTEEAAPFFYEQRLGFTAVKQGGPDH